MNPIIKIDGLSKSFGNLAAVSDMQMVVQRGEVRAVIGPNGAGKTTFFNLISGFVVPTAGRIVFDGEDITGRSPEARVAGGIARTFQITEVFPELSVYANIRTAVEVAAGHRLSLWLSSKERMQVEDRVQELLEMSGLKDRAERPAGELSHGDQRTIEIMTALALRPRLLLLDEPTAGMGEQETYDVTLLVRKLRADPDLSIILIEHDMRVVFHLADKITVMAEGRLLAEGTPQEIAANERVQAAYLGAAA